MRSTPRSSLAADANARAREGAPVRSRSCQARWAANTILCACCSAACPSYWWNGERYLGTRRAASGLSLADRFTRRGDGRKARSSRRSLPPLPLPHHHELCADLPQGPQSGEGHRRDQEDDGRATGVSRPQGAHLGKLTQPSRAAPFGRAVLVSRQTRRKVAMMRVLARSVPRKLPATFETPPSRKP